MPQNRKTLSERPSMHDKGYARYSKESYGSKRGRSPLAVIGALVCAIVIICGVGLVFAAPGGDSSQPEQAAEPVTEYPQRMSFVAVGDSLPDEYIGQYADRQSGEAGDGTYDYSFIFENIKPIVQQADVAYINQEVHIGGNEIGPKGYPSFNTTDEIADAIVDAGFDLVASATNHAYDWGPYGVVEHSRSVWNSKPVKYTGTATSTAEAEEIPVYDEGPMSIAFLNYTYGVNGYTEEDLDPYTVNFIDEDRIRYDVGRAKEMADIVMVAMHWGTENMFEPDDDQLKYAQLLADLDVDIVIGSHPHVIGEMHWVEGESGHKTLVAYSLGNFISRHESPTINNELEGMVSCDFVREEEGGEIHIENVVWTPLVNHNDAELNDFGVYLLKDYTQELAKSHRILGALEDPIAQMKEITQRVIGDEFTIDV